MKELFEFLAFLIIICLIFGGGFQVTINEKVYKIQFGEIKNENDDNKTKK